MYVPKTNSFFLSRFESNRERERKNTKKGNKQFKIALLSNEYIYIYIYLRVCIGGITKMNISEKQRL